MKSVEWIRGYQEAERQFHEAEEKAQGDHGGNAVNFGYFNPFPEGSEAHKGFKEGVDDFNQI